MADKRMAIMKLREQELSDIKQWCKLLKVAYQCGLSQGHYIGAVILVIAIVGFMTDLAVNIFLLPREWVWTSWIAMAIFGMLLKPLESYLAKRSLREYQKDVDELETNLIKKFDE